MAKKNMKVQEYFCCISGGEMVTQKTGYSLIINELLIGTHYLKIQYFYCIALSK